MRKFVDLYINGNLSFMILSGIAIILIIVSFFLPPRGAIDPSVLTATGELFAFAALGAVYAAISRGASAKVSKGDVSVEIEKKEKE